jgi:hypothetical protein
MRSRLLLDLRQRNRIADVSMAGKVTMVEKVTEDTTKGIEP